MKFGREMMQMAPLEGSTEHVSSARETYAESFKKALEIAEHPKTFTAMYESGIRVHDDATSSVEERMFCQEYLKKLTQLPLGEKMESYGAFQQSEESEKVRQLLAWENEASPLKHQRELLGLTQENEKPFFVQVLAPDNWDTMIFYEKEEWWLKTTGSPAQFVCRGYEQGKKITPTIFLSKDDASALAQPEDEDTRMIHEMLQHEYRHTQRKFGIENDHLFRFIDEACTNVGFYQQQAMFLDFMGLTTVNEFDFRTVRSAYESGEDTEMLGILEKIRTAFGDMGILLLGGMRSSEHTGDNDGIDNLPLVSVMPQDPEHPPIKTRFLETMLRLRAAQDSEWVNYFKQNMEGENMSRLGLEIGHQYLLYPYLKYSTELETPHVQKFAGIMEAEIERRKALGEAGWE